MRIDNRDDYIDLVAQAVIDRIEEKERVTFLVDAVVNRVLQLQREKADVGTASATESGSRKVEKSSEEDT